MSENRLTRQEFETLLRNRFQKRADWIGIAKTSPEGNWVCFGYAGLGENVYTKINEETYFMPWLTELIDTGILISSSPKYCYELDRDIIEFKWAILEK